ncbi:AbrB family transcriptional regulator [Bacteroides ovatus]|uniref:AbrB family transcriptional regulator n=1 Tax=Bacteroides ovatus TaxID=28116 RepID=UPI0022DEB470|nr:AbrB family transcriptional regulator [Bacteroides ovatus]
MTMKEKKKAASTTANLLNNRSKDSKSSRIIQQVRSIFLSGRKVTAKEINAETNSNDARRVISTLRNDEGWDIKDVRLDDRRKLYWLEPDKRQMSIDWEVNGNE